MAEPDVKMTEAIAFFERMLQTMPDDRTSLEFLSVAYEQTSQKEKHRDCLIRLADCLLHENDWDNAQSIAVRLSAFTDYPPARAAVDRVSESIQRQILKSGAQGEASGREAAVPDGQVPGRSASPERGLEVHALSRAASSAEMEQVWYWKEHDLLPKEVCMDILHILTENQITDQPLLISALALLDEQHPEMTERLMEVLQRVSEMPPVPLELFDVSAETVAGLPSEFVHIRGVLPFAKLGGEVLVAVLNPLNTALQDETVSRMGRPCHFFFAHPRVWTEVAKRF